MDVKTPGFRLLEVAESLRCCQLKHPSLQAQAVVVNRSWQHRERSIFPHSDSESGEPLSAWDVDSLSLILLISLRHGSALPSLPNSGPRSLGGSLGVSPVHGRHHESAPKAKGSSMRQGHLITGSCSESFSVESLKSGKSPSWCIVDALLS